MSGGTWWRTGVCVPTAQLQERVVLSPPALASRPPSVSSLGLCPFPLPAGPGTRDRPSHPHCLVQEGLSSPRPAPGRPGRATAVGWGVGFWFWRGKRISRECFFLVYQLSPSQSCSGLWGAGHPCSWTSSGWFCFSCWHNGSCCASGSPKVPAPFLSPATLLFRPVLSRLSVEPSLGRVSESIVSWAPW